MEDAAAFELEGLDEVGEFVVVGVGFVGEAGDEGGADGDVGDAGPHAVEEVADVGAVGLPIHDVQHVVGDVLEGDVDVFGDLLAGGDGLDEFVGPMGGVGVEEADPEFAFDRVEFAEEGGEGFAAGGVDAGGGFGSLAAALPAVHAEVGGVLGDEVEFLHAGFDEGACFADDGLLGTGAVLAADFRDDAERAGVVAAFRDLHVGHVTRGESEAGGGVVGDEDRLLCDRIEGVFAEGAVEDLADDGGDLGDLVEADEGVDFGEETGEVFLKALGEAAGDEDLLLLTGGVCLSGVDGVDDGGDGLVLGDVDEGAGVDDEDVGEVRFRGHDHAFLLEVADHDFGIDEILGAAEGDETDLGGHDLSAGIGIRSAEMGEEGEG